MTLRSSPGGWTTVASIATVGAVVMPALGGGGGNLTDVTAAANIDFVGTTGPSFPEMPPLSPDFDVINSIMQRTLGSGAAVGDYDGDGDLDLYLLGYEGFPNVLLRNDLDLGTATYTDVTNTAGVGDLGLSRVAHFVDLDNDGDLDLLLVNDNDPTSAHPPSRLYRNDGGDVFTDVTLNSGFDPRGYAFCGASLADYDLDGLLDVYVTVWTQDIGASSVFPGSNRLYRNLGNFVFEDVTDAVGLGGTDTDSFTAIFQDFDGDNRPDLFVAVDVYGDLFYWNTPGGFVSDSMNVGTTHTGNDMGVACADFDDDGDLDLYTTNITGPNFGTTQGNCFYQGVRTQSGTTAFSNMADPMGIDDTFWGWGVEFVDPDHDGDLDIFAATGFNEFVDHYQGTSHPLYGTPMVQMVAEDKGGFTRTTGTDTDDSRSLIAFDYDRDGDEDLLVTNVNGPVRLWQNDTAVQGHWLQVAVEQTRGNRQGIGVSVFATVDRTTKRREILAGESYLAGTPSEVHFGLGDALVVDQLRLEWTDGTETVLSDIAVDQMITVIQPGLGDFDGNGITGFSDLSALLATWGPCQPFPAGCPTDLDGNGEVGFPDLTTLLNNWN